MIHEDADEIEESAINFSWIYYICRAKLLLDDKKSGRLTFRQFRNLYQEYKNTFDLELYLTATRTAYADLKKKADKDEDWFD